MPFQPVKSEKISAAIIRQIEGLVLKGILRPGERLPSERDLAHMLAVSRPSLRDALAELQRSGLLDAQPGSGVFVAEVLGSAFSPALRDLMSRHEDAVFDYLSFREDVECLAARRATQFGSDTDLAVVQRVFEKMETAHSARDTALEAQLDAQFHMAIIEASHNIVMLHMMRSMYELLREGVFYNRQVMFAQSTTRQTLLDQHRAINAGLQARDADAAATATAAHMDYIRQSLRNSQRAMHREQVAQLRLEHEGSHN